MAHVGQTGSLTLNARPFDLVARVRLLQDAASLLVDNHRSGQPYSYVELHTDPPVASHSPWDHYDSAGGLLEALTLSRIVTGTEPGDADAAYARMLTQHQRDDGMLMLPPEPWSQSGFVAEMNWSPRAALSAWVTRAQACSDHSSLDRAAQLVRGLVRRAVWSGDICWYPGAMMPSDGWPNRNPPTAYETIIGGPLIHPLVRYAAYTGDQDAMRLAGGLARFARERSGAFTVDGNITARSGRSFHGAAECILGTLLYGVSQADDRVIEWSRRAYEHLREQGTDFGYFPRDLHAPGGAACDAAGVAAMVEIAITLGLRVNSIYLADAERFGRNHLLESQHTEFHWVEERVAAPFDRDVWCRSHPPDGVTTDHVIARAQGSFASWSLPNDRVDPNNPRLMMRSTAAAGRALYALWHYAVTRPEGAVRVNLHFSRDTRWASVTPHYEVSGDAAIEVAMKCRGALAIRIPDDVPPETIAVDVNGIGTRNEETRGGFVHVQALQPGDVVWARWPQRGRNEQYRVAGRAYKGRWLGYMLEQVDPPGSLGPTYDRPVAMHPVEPTDAGGSLREVDTL